MRRPGVSGGSEPASATPGRGPAARTPKTPPGRRLKRVSKRALATLNRQVAPLAPTPQLPLGQLAPGAPLPALPPPQRFLRVSLMDQMCASRGELTMHYMPFFFASAGGTVPGGKSGTGNG